jgi:hypothetical protein
MENTKALIAATQHLQEEIHKAIPKMSVAKYFSLMNAEAQVSKIIHEMTKEPEHNLITEPTKIRQTDKSKAYAEIITDKGTHLVARPCAGGCLDCVFDRKHFDGYRCSDSPLCSDRPDHDSIIWVQKET